MKRTKKTIKSIILVIAIGLIVFLYVRFLALHGVDKRKGEENAEKANAIATETTEGELVDLKLSESEPVTENQVDFKVEQTEVNKTETPTSKQQEVDSQMSDERNEHPILTENVTEPATTIENVTEQQKSDDIEKTPINTSLYGIELSKDKLEYDSGNDMYYVEEELKEISGIIKLPNEAASGSIIITNETGYEVLERKIELEDNFTVEDFGLVIGINNVNVQVEYENGYVSNEYIIIYNYCDNNMQNLDIDFSDFDNDGLNNFLEKMYGTNPDKADSDEDGLSDYEELVIIGTNPNEKDSDSDGIYDGEEDIDGDGLSNAEEEEFGTDNCTMDSDGDLLKDYDEVKVYMTNPLSRDTDGDGISDKWEIENNTDPLTYNSNVVYKSECKGFYNKVEIELTASGSIIESFTMDVHKSDSIYLSVSLPGYMGKGFDFGLDGDFEEAKIKYYFDESYLKQENLNPTIYYFNETTKGLEEIETDWDGRSNYVTAELPHFSTYILLDKTQIEEMWTNDIRKSSDNKDFNSNLKIVFVVDTSGSMHGDAMNCIRESLKTFVDLMGENDKASIVEFNFSGTVLCNLTNDKQLLRRRIGNLEVGGGTAIHDGLNKGINVLIEDDEPGEEIIILFTDGVDQQPTTFELHYKPLLEKAEANNIMIYAIGLGNVDNGILSSLAQGTNGNYYHILKSEEIKKKMEVIKEQTIDYKADDNDDNLSDYYAKLICSGELRLYSGDIIPQLIGSYEEFQKNDDFDGDGIKNGDEIEIKTIGQRVYIEMISNPAKADTDGDGFNDKTELDCGTDPQIQNIRANVVNKLIENDMYWSADFVNEYKNDWWLRARIYGGNVIGNFKVSYVNDYKKALLSFMTIYNEAAYEAMMLQQTIDCMEAIELDLIYYIADYIMAIQQVEEEITDYDILVADLKDCKEKTDRLGELRKKLLDYEKQPDNIGWQKELGEVKNDIYKLIDSRDIIDGKIKEVNVFGNMEDKLGRIRKAFPQKVVKGINKIFNGISLALDTGKIVLNTSEIIELYSSVEIGLQQQDELQILLLYVSSAEYNNDFMKVAALDLHSAMDDANKLYISEAAAIFDEVNNGAGYMVATQFLSKTPIGRVIDIVWSISNLIFHTGTVNEESIYLVAYGSSAMKYAQEIENLLVDNKVSEGFYITNDLVNTWLQILGQLRIVAEDQFAKTYRENGYIMKLIDYIKGYGVSDIDSMCADAIDRVVGLCKANGIVVKENFSGAYLNQ